MTFTARLTQDAQLVEQTLKKHLTPGQHFGPPSRLAAAMQYAALGGGKRLRPFLLMESAAIFDVKRERSVDAAAALECVHCYSLVHDDLPAMDDDDLRRGRPTVHKAYGEAAAILAGDALLTAAFEILADPPTHSDPAVRARLVLELARAAGWAGMAGGQMMDLAEQGKGGKVRLGVIQRIHTMKTGALIEFACAAGAILGGAGEQAEGIMREFGQTLGLAFQAADDILDATGETDILGKPAGRDVEAAKATVVARMGLEKARKYVADLEAAAVTSLAPFGDRAAQLKNAARFICNRTH